MDSLLVNLGKETVSWKYPTVLKKLSYIRRFFVGRCVPFALMSPQDHLVTNGANVLAGRGKYVVYSMGLYFDLSLPPGFYKAQWYDPRQGVFLPARTGAGGLNSFALPRVNDRVLRRRFEILALESAGQGMSCSTANRS